MTPAEQLHLIMTEIGPALQLADVNEFTEDNFWVLAFDEETLIGCQLDEAGERVVLSADVAVVDPDAQLRMYERLLQYNYLWDTTGGIRMALDGPGGMVVLLFEIPLAGIDLPRLETIVGNLRDIVVSWREVLEGGSLGASRAEGIPAATSMGPERSMRV